MRDEELELELELELERFFKSLPEIPVPELLTQRVKQRMDTVVRKRRRVTWTKRSLGTAAAGVLLFSGSVMLVPSFAVYAKQIPGVEAAVRWLQSAGEYMGVNHAKLHGYYPVTPYVTTWGEREVSIDHLYLEDDYIHLTVTMKGKDIEDAFRNNRIVNAEVEYSATAPELSEHSVASSSDSSIGYPVESREESQKRYQRQMEDIYVTKIAYHLDPAYVEELRSSKQPRFITIKLEKIKRNKEFKITHKESKVIQVPLGAENFKPARIVKLDQDWNIADKAFQQVYLDNIRIYPTRMLLDVGTRIDGGGRFELNSPNNWEDIQDNIQLTDETGKVYPILSAGINSSMLNGVTRSTWDFIPSIYFDGKPKTMTLHVKKIWMSQYKIADQFTIRMDDQYPKKIHYRGKEVVIAGVSYSNGYLRLRVEPDENGYNPLECTFLTYEPYYLKLQELDGEEKWKQRGLEIFTPETEAIPMTGKQLDEKYTSLSRAGAISWSPEFGYYSKNFDVWELSGKKMPVYDMMIMAPEQQEYRITARRYHEPVVVNQKLKFTVPGVGSADDRVGTVLQPAYMKTVSDLEDDIADKASRLIRKVAGRKVELNGVEEYKGTSYHDITVYSKDNKSYVKLDEKQGTADVHVETSYPDLDPASKRIIEAETGLSEQELALQAQKITRKMTKGSQDVVTLLESKGMRIVQMKGDQITSLYYEVPEDKVNQKAVQAAERAVHHMLGKYVKFEVVRRSMDMYDNGMRDVYRLENKERNVDVSVDYHTGQILDISLSDLYETQTDDTEKMFRQFTDDQVIEAASSDVMKVFGIRLAGYQVCRDEGSSYYTFTKPGHPTIEGYMNRHQKFSDYFLKPFNDTHN
ncbi:DUF4179 domain-containing protein [Paenibacillus sp. UMB4589-SE434]|uniref:DUF4179 domain-containing protein n=1 Tax=Paenibacillus sp. UMB4589-SE434 TaxID=3046314 RepID=UPI00254DC6B7|nr:DUF4179 domain-containing protein [Paenibacillus sp. UMB4589-SE434]MDK8183892.1 DUF4179 domain-containing protein [Paenibacillus sp. UMB4589-SE434]